MSATSLSSENGGKDHQFQILKLPGPRGAYESRQANGGLYVRVDMPGVPPDGIKLTKRGESHTVSFTGKAPRMWADCEISDYSDRVYGGYVVLDRNPCEIDIEMSLVNGSLKLFFPACDGLVHFFPPKKPAAQQSAGSLVKHLGDETDCCHNKHIELMMNMDDRFIPRGHEGFRNMSWHPRGCNCCKGGEENEEFDNVLAATKPAHINPFQLDGVNGIIEINRVPAVGCERLYFRVDLPGIEEENVNISVEEAVKVLYEAEGLKEHPLDEGGRTYSGGAMFRCNCCKIIDVKHTMKHGVLRFSICTRAIPGLRRQDCKFALISKKH